MKFIQEKDPHIQFKNNYVNHCHLCNEYLPAQRLAQSCLNLRQKKPLNLECVEDF